MKFVLINTKLTLIKHNSSLKKILRGEKGKKTEEKQRNDPPALRIGTLKQTEKRVA